MSRRHVAGRVAAVVVLAAASAAGAGTVSRHLAWAVGEYEVGQTGEFRALILPWNGRGWSKVAIPRRAPRSASC